MHTQRGEKAEWAHEYLLPSGGEPAITNYSRAVVVDIEECAMGKSPCGDLEACENTPGSYRCVCAEGYTISGTQCVGQLPQYHIYCTVFMKRKLGPHFRKFLGKS